MHTGATVQVHYTGKLTDGTVFDSTREREPFEFRIGAEEVLPAFEQAVLGMNPGDFTKVQVSAEEAYGPYREDLVLSVRRDLISSEHELAVGMKVWVHRENSEPVGVVIRNVSDATVELDTNHPLAGHDLSFEILLVGVT